MNEATTAADEATRHEEIIIIVNAQPKTVPTRVVSYTQVVELAFPTQPAPGIIYTVTYENAIKPHHEGSLVEGQSVTVKEKGTIFDVTPTNKS
ncbi:MAG TPA: multiubiquitin domain-containing protein [Ktedonobacteraceae bacterium]|nr:multiubiquitin domain-containing protein [Ktedonobacteraceae bacterium]